VIGMLLNTVSAILKYAPWLIFPLLAGSAMTVGLPFVGAYSTPYNFKMYCAVYFGVLILLALAVVAVLAWAVTHKEEA
jgi:hypothetical protein